MNTDKMYRVLATFWEEERFVECWCADLGSANRIRLLLEREDSDATVQLDEPKER